MPKNKRTNFHSRKLFYLLLLVVLFFAGISSFIYFYKFSQQSHHVARIDSSANWKKYSLPADNAFSFKLPSNWKSLEFWKPMPPNAYGIQSPDFSSEQNFYKISSGSIIDIAVDKNLAALTPEAIVQAEGNGSAKIMGYYQTDQFKAIKYKHHCCEELNTIEGFLFFRNGIEYKIQQHYRLNAINPYPNLLEQIVSTFKFTN